MGSYHTPNQIKSRRGIEQDTNPTKPERKKKKKREWKTA